jgi:multiple sugar transport system substrate-binding protein
MSCRQNRCSWDFPAALAIVAFLLAGCENAQQPVMAPTATQPPSAGPLRVIVVDDAPLGQAIARAWKAEAETEIQVREITQSELDAASRLPGDVLVFATGDLGGLAERGLIAPLGEQILAGSQFDRRDVFDLVRGREIVWGNRTLAVPLGSPQLMLAVDMRRLGTAGIVVPATWPEYQAACIELSEKLKSGDDKSQDAWPAIEPLADGWAGQTFLARAAAYAMHRDQISPLFDYESMQPLVAEPPYVRALTELAAAAKHFPPGERVTPAEAIELVIQGKVAMALAWTPPVREEQTPCPFPPQLALVPGSDEAYNFATKSWESRDPADARHAPLLAVAGRVGAVSTSAADPRGAESFLAWLSSSETSARVCPVSAATTLFRRSHIPEAQRWVANANNAKWHAETLERSLSLSRGMALRLPGRRQYLDALDRAVLAATRGEKSPEAALAEAAAAWDKITKGLGLDAQRQALRRDLGLANFE